jgi:predicted dehydrogenase
MIGCGLFGQFCLEAYQPLDLVRPVAVADANADLARRVGQRFSMVACSPQELLTRPDVEIVHLATPPGTHRELTLAAFAAGKHVLCEKPLATTVADAQEMIAAARSTGRLLAVNLMMRYNPLTVAVEQILRAGLLGEPLRALFENYATDEPLPPEHWFWNRRISGGIFIEHSVHFFDLFESWLGPGKVLSAHQLRRPGSADIVDQVQCTTQHGSGVLANFYHGFHQSRRMDRQEFRIVTERGEISLFEWMPTRLRIDATLLDREVSAITAHLRDPRIDRVQGTDDVGRAVYSHHRHYEVDGRFVIEADAGLPKEELYGVALRGLLEDQAKAIRERSHRRRIDESNGLRSLQMAVAATDLSAPAATQPAAAISVEALTR